MNGDMAGRAVVDAVGGRPAAAAPDLLSEEYISPKVEVAVGGHNVKVHVPIQLSSIEREARRRGMIGRRRGAIKSFSESSRSRLLAVVDSLNEVAALPSEFAFVTLTYHEWFPSPMEAKVHLDTFIKRFEREFGPRGLIWKCEPQLRSAPHFHLLIYRPEAWSAGEFCLWVAHAWNAIAGKGSELHLLWHLGLLAHGNKPCVETVRDFGAVRRYAGKYLAKVSVGDPNWKWPGRFWGVRRPGLLPIERYVADVSLRVAQLMARQCKRWFNHQVIGVKAILPQSIFGALRDERNRPFHHWRLPAGFVSGNKVSYFNGGESQWAEGVRLVPIRCHWRRSRGGGSFKLSQESAERLLSWANATAANERAAASAPPVIDSLAVADRREG